MFQNVYIFLMETDWPFLDSDKTFFFYKTCRS